MPEGNHLNSARGINALLFFSGLEMGYNVMGGTNSAPQTTELRIEGAEGGGAAEETLMKWVHLAGVKIVVYTGLVSIVAGSWWAFLGGLISAVEMHCNYIYAVRSGKRRRGLFSRTIPMSDAQVSRLYARSWHYRQARTTAG